MDFPKSTQELLEKYWAAETTPEEEVALREMLAKEKGKHVYGTYFHFLTEEAGTEMQTEVHPLTQTKVVHLRRVLSVAASVIVLVAAGFMIQRTMTSNMSTGSVAAATADSFENPEEAYEEARMALLLVSQKINKTRKQAGDQLAKTQPYLDIIK
jgi:hypothetical protein